MPNVRQMPFKFATLKSLARRREKMDSQCNEGKTGEGGKAGCGHAGANHPVFWG